MQQATALVVSGALAEAAGVDMLPLVTDEVRA
jgi:histidine ammonia-lyase